MNVIKLENWSLVPYDDYSAPEQGFKFHGNCYNHPEHEDGTSVKTSHIIGYKDRIFITYSGNYYELGNVDPEYEKAFPDAYNRIIKRAEKLDWK